MLPQKRTSLVDLLLSVWWVSWLGIIGGFLCVGISEVKIEFSRGAVSRPSLALLVAVPLSWICSFIADSKANERTPKIVKLLTVAGTSPAAFTLIGIWFFIANAARAR
jgi:hypothetical protein